MAGKTRATGATGKCSDCQRPIYQIEYEFGGQKFTKWKHRGDRTTGPQGYSHKAVKDNG